ncbi:MAG TPA: DUF732 domain-containing protein [Mycobacterium sp.]|nr:DUF732 domain-containing protein [Mycobacterium sp.]
MTATTPLLRGCIAILVAAMMGAGVGSASPNATEPGYCGARQDPLDCVPFDGPAPPPPTPAEAAFLKDGRFFAPNADDATLLRIGRGTCIMLRGGTTTGYIVADIARHLSLSDRKAGQVMDGAMGDICPDVHIGANGADDSRPY